MCQPNPEKRHEIQKGQSERRDESAPPLKGQYREEVLREIVDHASRAMRPANRNQVCAEYVALREARILYHLAELHIVEHFHAQRFVSSHSVVGAAPNQVE